MTESQLIVPEAKVEESFFEKWLWRISGLTVWGLISEAVLQKVFSFHPVNIPPWLLFIPLLLLLKSLYKSISEAAFFLLYVVAFPFVLIIFSIFQFIGLLSKLKAIAEILISFITFGSSKKGFLFYILGTLSVFLIFIMTTWLPVLVLLGFLAIVLIFLGLIISSKFALNPLLPAEISITSAKRILLWTIEMYLEKILKHNLEKKNKDDLDSDEDMLSKLILYLPTVPQGSYNTIPRKYLALIFSIYFVMQFTMMLALFGAVILGFNALSTCFNSNVFWISDNLFGLFSSLPFSSPYFDCIFQGFTILVGCQDFTLQTTSLIGRVLIMFGVVWNIFTVVFLVSAFFTILGNEKDPETDFDGTKETLLKLLSSVREEVQLAKQISEKNEVEKDKKDT